jgi:hypothetical protein
VFKWLLAPATIIGVFSFVVFILADFERMKTLRSIAAGAFVLACLVTVGSGLLMLYERRRSASDRSAAGAERPSRGRFS